jgi:hypothetical protein
MQWISDSDIEKILIWQDGTIVWEVAPTKGWWESHWYQATIPTEKVEAAVREIVADFAKYPAKNRPLESRIVYTVDANSSPFVYIHSSQLYECMWMDDYMFEFYKQHRDVLQSDDKKAIYKTITKLKEERHHYKNLVRYYRMVQPRAELSFPLNPIFSKAEVLKCVEIWSADAEHLLLVEKKILALLPSTKDLEPKKLETSSYKFQVEWAMKGGKSEFFFSPISETESSKIWEEIRKRKPQEWVPVESIRNGETER